MKTYSDLVDRVFLDFHRIVGGEDDLADLFILVSLGQDIGLDRRLPPEQGDPDATRESVETASAKLTALVNRFDDPDQPYLSQPHPGQAPRFSDYTQLARVAEWAALDEGE